MRGLWLGLGAALALCFSAVAPAAALDFPALAGQRVVDEAGVLSPDTRGKLTQLLAEHERQTRNQVVVVTLKSLRGTSIEQYGYQLGRAWGIGQKGANNGALLIVSPSTHDVRIEVGYGLEGVLTDAQSKLIVENVMLPYFRKGDYDGGLLNGTITTLEALGGHPSATASAPLAGNDNDTGDSGGGHIPIILIVIVLWFVFGRFFWPLFFLGGLGGGRGWGGGGFGGGGFGGGSSGGFSGGGGSFGGGGASGHW